MASSSGLRLIASEEERITFKEATEVQEFHLVYSCLHSASYNGGYCANEMADSRDSSFQHGQVKDARFLHRNGSMSSGVHEEIGVLFGKADILALGASTSH
ncbi:unnamed protein product [Sphagnum jensenii]|uniref:Uncharacterized protein n=1 Tax=Sphagnum jensenii TaxID=128206 RepID=A0ABP0WRB0_9BRYO